MRTLITFMLMLMLASGLLAQVDDIKRKSSENASKSSGSSESGSSSGGGGNLFGFINVTKLILVSQASILEKRDSVPRVVSFEVFAHGAMQPSNYYLALPRVRGNWGLFSTDFRFNYLYQQDQGQGYSDLSTIDWQVLQFNILNSKYVLAHVGFGTMYELFGAHQHFFEWTTGMSIMTNAQRLNFNWEFREAADYQTGAFPRREFNLSVEKQLFRAGRWRGYLTVGGLYQRYYSSVSVWGLQSGLTMRVF